MNERRNDVGNKVTIGILIGTITILIGIFLNASIKGAEMSRASAEEAKVMAYKNSTRLSVLETQYVEIMDRLQEIKTLLRK